VTEKRRTFEGKGLAPGVAWGVAYRIEPRHPDYFRIRIAREEIEAEVARFRQAIARTREQYLVDKRKFEAVVGTEHSYIIDAHLLMLEDRLLLEEIERRIAELLDSPEKAIRHVADELLAVYDSLEDSFFRERAFDFEEVIDRILANLTELGSDQEPAIEEDLILVGSEVGLSVLSRFPLGRVKGLVLTRGGETSHIVIVARSLRIPVVSGIENLRERIRTGDLLLADGNRGRVEVNVPAEDAGRYVSEIGLAGTPPPLGGDREPCTTADGERVFLYANMEFLGEVAPAFDLGAEGIGLFRSEFFHLSRSGGSSDEEHEFLLYRQVAEAAGERPVVIRTLDIARQSDSRSSAGEEVAALGLRGIRLSLRRPEVFRAQVRAIVRARGFGDLRIVLPMISSVDELIQGRALIGEVEDEVGGGEPRIPVGVLLEVPAAILTLEAIAAHCDFLAVGTNDLIQYLLAAGRLNEEISDLYNPLHPAVLQSLYRVVEVAGKTNLSVTVCGEMAAHPLHASILVGLGYRCFSMNAFAIPSIKATLRAYEASALRDLTAELLGLAALRDIEKFVGENLRPDPARLLTQLGTH
jgi:phosphoenolpyruvate-protein phosphotransferase (PTS system enzyme I)